MIEILLKLEKNVQKRRVTRGVLKDLTFSMIFQKHLRQRAFFELFSNLSKILIFLEISV